MSTLVKPDDGILASKSGTPGATRTPDTRFRKPLLYPPELQGHAPNWSNLQPLHHSPVFQRTIAMAKKPTPKPMKRPGTNASVAKPIPIPMSIPAGIKRPLNPFFFLGSSVWFAITITPTQYLNLVEIGGFEPPTSAMRTQRSPY